MPTLEFKGKQFIYTHHLSVPFLICVEQVKENGIRFALLETKGEHLKGNDDTEFKRRLFELLSEHSAKAVKAGELQLDTEDVRLTFKMLLSENWQEEVRKVV